MIGLTIQTAFDLVIFPNLCRCSWTDNDFQFKHRFSSEKCKDVVGRYVHNSNFHVLYVYLRNFNYLQIDYFFNDDFFYDIYYAYSSIVYAV